MKGEELTPGDLKGKIKKSSEKAKKTVKKEAPVRTPKPAPTPKPKPTVKVKTPEELAREVYLEKTKNMTARQKFYYDLGYEPAATRQEAVQKLRELIQDNIKEGDYSKLMEVTRSQKSAIEEGVTCRGGYYYYEKPHKKAGQMAKRFYHRMATEEEVLSSGFISEQLLGQLSQESIECIRKEMMYFNKIKLVS